MFNSNNSSGDEDSEETLVVVENLDHPYRRDGRIEDEIEVEKISLIEAKKIMGDMMFGPEEVGKAFDCTVDRMPDIPFPEEVLKKAKKMGMFLVLRIDDTGMGEPMDYVRVKGAAIDRDHILHLNFKKLEAKNGQYDKRYERIYPYLKESVNRGWSLVSTKPIKKSRGKNFFDHNQMIADEIKKQFSEFDLPPYILDALADFESKKELIQELRSSPQNSREGKKKIIQGDKMLLNCSFTEYTRPSLTEMHYYYAVLRANGKNKLFKKI